MGHLPMVHGTMIVVWVSWEASGENPSCEPADGRTMIVVWVSWEASGKNPSSEPADGRTMIVVWVWWEASGKNPSCEPADGRTRMLIHRDPRAMICVARHSHDGNIHSDVPVSCVAKIVFCNWN